MRGLLKSRASSSSLTSCQRALLNTEGSFTVICVEGLSQCTVHKWAEGANEAHPRNTQDLAFGNVLMGSSRDCTSLSTMKLWGGMSQPTCPIISSVQKCWGMSAELDNAFLLSEMSNDWTASSPSSNLWWHSNSLAMHIVKLLWRWFFSRV